MMHWAESISLSTRWPFKLYQTSLWHHNKSSVWVWGACTKTQPLLRSQQEVGNNMNGQRVIAGVNKITWCSISSLTGVWLNHIWGGLLPFSIKSVEVPSAKPNRVDSQTANIKVNPSRSAFRKLMKHLVELKLWLIVTLEHRRSPNCSILRWKHGTGTAAKL